MFVIMRFFFIATLLFIFNSGFAQNPIGIWKTVDDTDGRAKSHIEIYENDGKLYGKVIKLLEAADIHFCEKCKGDKKDQPIEGMVLLEEMKEAGKSWKGGRILDPASGKSYKCLIELENEDKLKLRGYIGMPALGRTQYWYRVKAW